MVIDNQILRIRSGAQENPTGTGTLLYLFFLTVRVPFEPASSFLRALGAKLSSSKFMPEIVRL